jgi:geranyl-CoA carboxylase alpha subunit
MRVLIQHAARAFTVRDLSFEPERRVESGRSDGKLLASTNGRIAAVLVKVGDQVRSGQPIVTIEAMKMENVHLAPMDGVVAFVASEGEQVETNAVVAEISAASGASRAI